jgi:hypothetical protein
MLTCLNKISKSLLLAICFSSLVAGCGSSPSPGENGKDEISRILDKFKTNEDFWNWLCGYDVTIPDPEKIVELFEPVHPSDNRTDDGLKESRVKGSNSKDGEITGVLEMEKHRDDLASALLAAIVIHQAPVDEQFKKLALATIAADPECAWLILELTWKQLGKTNPASSRIGVQKLMSVYLSAKYEHHTQTNAEFRESELEHPLMVFDENLGKFVPGGKYLNGKIKEGSLAVGEVYLISVAPEVEIILLVKAWKRLKMLKGARQMPKLTGQLHHVISKKIYGSLQRHPNLRGLYNHKDKRYEVRAASKNAHIGYQSWHRGLDKEIADWVDGNPDATKATFEKYLKEVYSQDELIKRFPIPWWIQIVK